MARIEKRKVKISDLKKTKNNPRKITEEDFEKLKRSLSEFPEMLEAREIIVDENNRILGGHQRVKALKALGETEIEVKAIIGWTEEQKDRFVIQDNLQNGEWDDEILSDWDREKLKEWGMDLPDVNPNTQAKLDLEETFLVPPFTVLDTRQGYWQQRRHAWDRLIGDKGESREGTLYHDINSKSWVSRQLARSQHGGGVSILDACLCEIVLKWFTPAGSTGNKTFDPFAGDTVFGFVSSYCGNEFIGTELRKEQADANNERVKGMSAIYYNDDGQNIGKYVKPGSQDLLFSCPPYFDLEKYSDDPRDASNQDYDGFIKILDNAFTAGIKALKDNRFAVIVMSNVRASNGAYHDICGDITRIFQREGMMLYNELVLVNSLAGAPLKAERQMRNRKPVRCHQEVLVYLKGLPQIIPAHEDIKVFYKGDPGKIQEEMGSIREIGLTDEFTDMAEEIE